MLSSRKALISNLNYVHLQHVSLGVHLSSRPEMKEGTTGQDTGLKDVSGCLHQWKDTSDTILVDANSNDPSVPCQCCDQHFGHDKSLQYGSNENLEAIMCDDYLSPDDLPLSPLSPSSPSTDSSSSSDFTLDDSPVSLYYKEYAEDNLDTPDQQPNIIPLDADFYEPVSSVLDDSLNPSTSNTITDSESSQSNSSELTVNNNNMEPDDVPFIDWNSDTILDSNCNAVEIAQQPDLSSLSSPPTVADKAVDPEPQTRQNIANVNQIDFHLWPVDEEILPGLSMPEDSARQTPKKTITSFHELAQKRRRSGVQLPQQLKKDKSDWLIVFSPDTEHPPVNELTTSAFYHGVQMPQTQPLHEGKEVTTFRELRCRSTNSKQSGQQTKAQNISAKGHQDSNEEASVTMEVHHITEEPNMSCPFIKEKTNFQEELTKDSENPRGILLYSNKDSDQSRRQQKPNTEIQEAPQRLWSQKDYRSSTLADTSSAIMGLNGQHKQFVLKNDKFSGQKENPDKENQARVRRRGMADGGNRKGLEGASSPPQRALLPLLDSPDMAILLSPLFPRIRSRKMGPCSTNTLDTGGDIEPLMADGDEESAPREKKSFLISIGSAVDKIISHFNASRNQVQKAQLGDSRLSPKLGYLILNNLCPSLYSLIGDGLKSFQKDVIIGRRRLSPWNLVEVSTKSGPESLHVLFYKVSHLQQLRDPQRRFNAFIFGLLNTKQLDIWVHHLHQIYAEELSFFYYPTGFLTLAATSRPDLHEELMLILQPLSALTFHTDLLFEHYHLPLQEPPVPQHPATQVSDNWGVPSFQDIVHLGNWLAHNLSGSTGRETQKSDQKPSQSCIQNVQHLSGDSQLDGAFCSNHSPGDSFVFNTSQDVSSPITNVTQTPTQVAISKAKDSNTTWWGHLSQASRMYIPAKKESFAFPSFKKLPIWGIPEPQDQSTPDQQLSSKQNETTEHRVHEKSSLDSQNNDNGNEILNLNMEGSKDPAGANISRDEIPTPVEDSAVCKQPMSGDTTPTQTPKEKVHWFGQLFGANSAQGCETEGKTVKSRRPSSWLPPNISVMKLMQKTSTPEKEVFPVEEVEKPRSDGKPERALRALCDHSASGETQLSFRKGDILQLLGTVDEDWIRCRHGDDTGLVPVGYTSLIL